MAEFMDNVKLIISTMSYNVFAPIPNESDNKKYFFCRKKSAGALAKGFISAGGFTVVKGSAISNYVVPSLKEGSHTSYYKLRIKLIDDGTIKDNIFQRNYEFSSPSAASAIIIGSPSNGNIDWKTEDGKALRDA